jgi:hypothetical protein
MTAESGLKWLQWIIYSQLPRVAYEVSAGETPTADAATGFN